MIPLPLALPLICLTISVVMGAAVVARDPGLRIHRLLGGLLAATAWWSLCEILWQLQDAEAAVLAFIRLSSLGWMALGPLCLHIFAEMVGRPALLVRRALPLAYACAALGIVVYQLTPAVAHAVHSPHWGWGYQLDPVFFVPYSIAVTPPTAVLLLWPRFAPDAVIEGGERHVSRILFLGVVAALVVTLLTEVALPAFGVQWLHLGTASLVLVTTSAAIGLNRYGFSLISPAAFAQEILATLGDGIALLYVDGRIRFANEALGRLAGVPPQELRERPIESLLPGALAALEGTSEAVELELRAERGARIPVAVAAVRLGKPVSTSLVVRDLREMWRLRDRVVTAGRLATVGELSTAIAREIRDPAEEVESQLLALERQWAKASRAPGASAHEAALAEGEELIAECIEGVARVGGIARAVGAFDGGPRDGKPEDLNDVVESALRVAAARLPAGVRLERALAPIPLVSCASREMLQVVLNLLLNAGYALRDGGCIRVSTGAESGEVWIEVADDGPGIDPAVRERIFDPFFTTKPVGEGTGLGLPISYHIVKRHGGELRCESAPGEGARFQVRLPRD